MTTNSRRAPIINWPRAACSALPPLVLLVFACGEAKSTSHTADSASNVRQASAASTTDADQQGACELPSSDAPGACHAGRQLARCTSDNGGSLCITDEGGRCEGSDDSFSCESVCEPDEYALSCAAVGGLAPGGAASQSPPEACRSLFPTPGGIVYYCCPCE
jgi:hypothetical protein